MMTVRRRIIVAAALSATVALGTVGCSSNDSTPKASQSKKPAATSSPSRLPLAMPNAAGPQPKQVDPNELLPGSACDAFRESGALNLTSPLKDTRSYQPQFVRGGWCVFGPKGVTRGAPIFSILYEGRKGLQQVAINYGDALMYSRELFERERGSLKQWKSEGIPPINTDPDFTKLVSINKPNTPRRYTDVVVTTGASPAMTLLIHFKDPITHNEATQLAYNAASAAYRVGLRLR